MTDLEQKIFMYFQDGDKCLTIDNVVDAMQLPNEQVEEALENLVESEIFYSLDTFVGKMYGIDSTEALNFISIDFNKE